MRSSLVRDIVFCSSRKYVSSLLQEWLSKALLGFREETIANLSEWHVERKAQLMEGLRKKYPVEEDAEHQIAIFESTIGRNMREQLEGIQNNLEAMKKHFSVKFRTKKNAPKIKFQGKAEDHDIPLATFADKKWIDVVANADENEPPADSLPKVKSRFPF